MEIINKTPHKIVIKNEAGDTLLKIPKSNNPIRLKETRQRLNNLVIKWIEIPVDLEDGADGILRHTEIPLYKRVLMTSSLPPEEKDTYYIVSMPVALLNKNRKDFLVPDKYIRDEDGNVTGVLSLSIVEGI